MKQSYFNPVKHVIGYLLMGITLLGCHDDEGEEDEDVVPPFIYEERAAKVEFEEDTLLLSELGATEILFAGVYDTAGSLIAGDRVDFTMMTPDIVSFYSVEMNFTGTTRGMRMGIQAESIGETRIIALHKSGLADTAYIKVEP